MEEIYQRINFSSTCMINMGGEYLQVLSRKHPVVYSDVGDLVRCTLEGREDLIRNFNARFLSYHREDELMLEIPLSRFCNFENWIQRREFREKSPKRVINKQVLKPLGIDRKREESPIRFKHPGVGKSNATYRLIWGTSTQTVLCYFDIYYVELGLDIEGTVQRYLQTNHDDPPRFRTVEVRSISRSLLTGEFRPEEVFVQPY